MHPSIAAGSVAQALHLHGEGIGTLSLDCFDTLLWRATHAPADVFAELAGPGLRSRVYGEAFARQLQRVARWRSEVELRDVYRQLQRGADGDSIEAAVREELDAEARHCYAFAPTVALMREARARGLRVVVVSDTYLREPELRALIARAAGDDVVALIDRIFCSCEHGVSKADGLFRHVLDALAVPAASVLHIGDNAAADVAGAARHGVRALHLVQFPDGIEQQLRLEAAVATVFDPSLRASRPLMQVQRAALATGAAAAADVAERVGYASVGPIVHGFVRWVIDEASALAARGERVRPLFLLRDAHLPHAVWQTQPDAQALGAARVELSRYAAFAASFVDEDAVLQYLAEFGGTRRFDALANQLLFTAGEAAQLVERTRRTDKPLEAFVAEVRKPHHLRKIVDRSAAYADRLVRYLRRQAGIEAGDTLMMVDLGYAGTVQDRLAPVLRRLMNVQVTGRYLALRDVPNWRADKAGLLGPDRYDHRTLDALCAYVAVLEQLCTVEQASVVDYDEQGEPIRKATDLKARQSDVRAAAQAGCLRYAASVDAAWHRAPRVLGAEAYRQSTCGALGRLLFLPSPDELALFSGFEHDVNMGVLDKVTLFDPHAAHDGLLKRGLFYTNDNPRQYLPAEIRGQGMPLSLSLLTLRRFALGLTHDDFRLDHTTLPVMVADGSHVTRAEIDAYPTHDGWYMAAVPMGAARYAIGLQLGERWEWAQLHSLTVTRRGALMRDGDLSDSATDVTASAMLDGIERHAGGLLRAAQREGFVFVPPFAAPGGGEALLTVVFRPIAERATAAPAPGRGHAYPAAATTGAERQEVSAP